jgi:uncharacterized SAM-binding protein YcdF (DUF218 family)
MEPESQSDTDLMKHRLIILGVLTILIVLYISGCRKAGSWLVKNDKIVHGDAMLILMGSIPDRVLQAADLYNKKLTQKIILVEENMDGFEALEKKGVHILSETEKAYSALVRLGIPSDSIIVLPGAARSTINEAMIIREYVAHTPGIDTMILVSSAAHTRRASIIFRCAFKKARENIAINCSPSVYSNFNCAKWWKNKDGIQTVMLEYLKLADFILFDKHKLNKVKE